MRFFIPSYSMLFSVKPNKENFTKEGFEIEEIEDCGFVEIKTIEDLLRFHKIVYSLGKKTLTKYHTCTLRPRSRYTETHIKEYPDCKWELDIREEYIVVNSFV